MVSMAVTLERKAKEDLAEGLTLEFRDTCMMRRAKQGDHWKTYWKIVHMHFALYLNSFFLTKRAKLMNYFLMSNDMMYFSLGCDMCN